MKEIRPQKSNISFDDFLKLDVRLCKILTCSKVPKTNKLYLLEIDTGAYELGVRQVVTAVADRLTEEQLVGKIFPFVLNLEPREIKGIRSEAMIVLAENIHDGKFITLCSNEDDDIGATLI